MNVEALKVQQDLQFHTLQWAGQVAPQAEAQIAEEEAAEAAASAAAAGASYAYVLRHSCRGCIYEIGVGGASSGVWSGI
jgi:hypothetical protein